jgi:glucose-6-phosphate isomerase
VVALGATDQHSQLQLYLEGPFNKMVTFLTAGKSGREVAIPHQPGEDEVFSYLGGHSLGELFEIEAEATRLALTRAGRSNMRLILPEVNAFTIGQLLFLLEVQTVFAGGLYNVDPLDQPAVESGKQYAYGMMGRNGYEAKATEVKEWREKEGKYTV